MDFQQYKTQIERFCQKNRILLCVVFGSYAQEKETFRSDLDIALLPERGVEVDILDMINELAEIFHKEIDVVIIDYNRDPVLLREIFEKGIPLYEASPELFIERKIWAWKLYQDTKKLRDFRDKRIREYIEKISSE